MPEEDKDKKITKGICPVCDAKLVFAEGCKHCQICGWSTCSIS
ncbi:MAG: hypothetical protein AB1391_00030 [Candidatus Micrarchaeota archaeon]